MKRIKRIVQKALLIIALGCPIILFVIGGRMISKGIWIARHDKNYRGKTTETIVSVGLEAKKIPYFPRYDPNLVSTIPFAKNLSKDVANATHIWLILPSNAVADNDEYDFWVYYEIPDSRLIIERPFTISRPKGENENISYWFKRVRFENGKVIVTWEPTYCSMLAIGKQAGGGLILILGIIWLAADIAYLLDLRNTNLKK